MFRNAHHAGSRILSAFRPPHPNGVWGDGLVDLSLTTLWYPVDNIDDVSDDEFVLHIPTLARRITRDRLAVLLQQALAAHARRAAEALVAEGVMSSSVAAAQVIACTLSPLAKPTSSGGAIVSKPQRRHLSSQYLAALPSLMIASVLKRINGVDSSPHSLADVLVGSVQARFNGAYSQPQYTFAHELLSAGAWIGQVLAGRPALMPLAIAECLLDVLTHDSGRASSDERVLLTYYAEAAGGLERILFVARKVVSRGYPVQMPGLLGTYEIRSHPIWNSELATQTLCHFQEALELVDT